MKLYTSQEELPIVMGAEELAAVLQISRAGAYQLMNSEGFPVIRIGKRMLVPRERFFEWMEVNTYYEKCSDSNN